MAQDLGTLVQILQDPGLGEKLIVIDALNECEDGYNSAPLEWIKTFSTNNRATNPHFK